MKIKTTPRVQGPRVFIVGGGVAALSAAIELHCLARRMGLRLDVQVFEAGAFGGGPGDRSAAPRCQGWLHRQGTIYAPTQPAVSLALQRSTRRLRQLAPDAFRDPLALAVVNPAAGRLDPEALRVLGVWHEPVPADLVHAWFPALRLPDGCAIYRVGDGTFDVRLLGMALAMQARRREVRLVRRGVRSLALRGDSVRALTLDDSDQVVVGPADVVVLACGARMRPLLADAGLRVPGLRLFRSHLVATDAFGLPAILACLRGGVNCIPHELAAGTLLNVFGDSGRDELPPESDNEPLHTDAAAVDRICREVEADLGLKIPTDRRLAWPAVKTEIVAEGIRSQAHHARLVPGVSNLWMAIPGKLSQAAACARDLAAKIVRESLQDEIARPIWEPLPTQLDASTISDAA